MRPEKQAGNHRGTRQEQQGVGRVHPGKFVPQEYVKHKPHALVGEPESPARSLEHPEPAETACAGQPLPGERQQGKQDEQPAGDVAERRPGKTARKQQTARG